MKQDIGWRAEGYFWAGLLLASTFDRSWEAFLVSLFGVVLLKGWSDRRLNRWRDRSVRAVPRTVNSFDIDLRSLKEWHKACQERDEALDGIDAAERRARILFDAKQHWINELRDLGERVVQSGVDWAHYPEPIRSVLQDVAAHAAGGRARDNQLTSEGGSNGQ